MPLTPYSRDRRSEVNRKWITVVHANSANGPRVSSQLQAPSVKGFDFAKLHLGQHSKDDMMVIQEPGSLPAPVKEATPSDGGDLNTPKSKGSSTKAARSGRRRGRSDCSACGNILHRGSHGNITVLRGVCQAQPVRRRLAGQRPIQWQRVS